MVTDTTLPDRRGAYVDSRGSACWRTGTTSVAVFERSDFALLLASRERKKVNSVSVASDGWTEKTTSLDKYAIRATASCR